MEILNVFNAYLIVFSLIIVIWKVTGNVGRLILIHSEL